MFHRLTLFALTNNKSIAAIDTIFRTHQLSVDTSQCFSNEQYTVQQWRWDGSTSAENDTSQLISEIETTLENLGKHSELDYVLQSTEQAIEKIKLAVFDMDSTLIQAEVMDELAYVAGIGPQVAAITARAMAGELDFEQSFRSRLALLKGFETSQLEAINQTIDLMPGATQLMNGLQKRGIYCAILSGGFSYFADDLANKLGMQEAFSNPLEEVDGKLTGQVAGTILDANRKVELMEMLRNKLGLSISQCLAVGDGANDLPMLNKAGLGVAFHGKPLVRQQAPHQINNFDLDVLLHLV